MSSLIATLIDFSVTIVLKEVFGFWYLFSTSVGSIIGGAFNFQLGRRWVFNSRTVPASAQAVRYLLVWIASILLNISGVFVLTHFGHMRYLFSKVAITLIVGIFFNYNLQKKYVFNFRHQTQEFTDL